MSIEILGSKLPDVMGTYRRLSHTVEACMAAGATGTPRAPRGIRGDGYGAYGGSVVSGS